MDARYQTFCWLLGALGAVGYVPSAWAQGPGGAGCPNGAGPTGMMSSQGMMLQAAAQLSASREQLSNAQSTASTAESQISASNERIEGARQAITDARVKLRESSLSQKSLEAEILAAQPDGSPYAKANLAFTAAQSEYNAAKSAALSSETYLARRAAAANELDAGARLAKLQRDTLADDLATSVAADKLKRSQSALSRIKLDLFKTNDAWVAAAESVKLATTEESKAIGSARSAALRKLPAKRELRDAQADADRALANIAQAEQTMRSISGPGMRRPPGPPDSPGMAGDGQRPPPPPPVKNKN